MYTKDMRKYSLHRYIGPDGNSMRRHVRSVVVSGILLFAIGALGPPPCGFAQTAGKDNKVDQKAEGPKKPTRKADLVSTGDPVARLSVQHEPEAPRTSTPESSSPANDAAGTTADDTTKKAAEIALTEKLIKEKQQRITLLLRLFASDEQAFLRDPASAENDPAVKERRKYEQDELLWETAELAKLKKRMIELEKPPLT